MNSKRDIIMVTLSSAFFNMLFYVGIMHENYVLIKHASSVVLLISLASTLICLLSKHKEKNKNYVLSINIQSNLNITILQTFLYAITSLNPESIIEQIVFIVVFVLCEGVLIVRYVFRIKNENLESRNNFKYIINDFFLILFIMTITTIINKIIFKDIRLDDIISAFIGIGTSLFALTFVVYNYSLSIKKLKF